MYNPQGPPEPGVRDGLLTEKFAYSHFLGYRYAPSRTSPGAMAEAPGRFRCPRCGRERGPLTHGVRDACEGCRLEFVRHGSALYVTCPLDEALDTTDLDKVLDAFEKAKAAPEEPDPGSARKRPEFEAPMLWLLAALSASCAVVGVEAVHNGGADWGGLVGLTFAYGAAAGLALGAALVVTASRLSRRNP